VLDTILELFEGLLLNATDALLPFGIALLAATMAIEFFMALVAAGTDGYLNYPKLLGITLLICIQASVTLFVLQNISWIADDFWASFMEYAGAAGGGLIGTPSTLWEQGFQIAHPLVNYLGWPIDMLLYRVAGIIVILMFLAVAVHVVLVTIEFNIAVAAAVILVPLGMLTHAGFFYFGVVRWLGATLVRAFLLAIIIAGVQQGLAPWTSGLALEDPTQYSSWVLAGMSIVLALAAWFLPSIGAGIIAGGGGLGVGHLLGAGIAMVGTFRMGSAAIRGVSRMVSGR
jgi:type IV secretory pathway TrbL component